MAERRRTSAARKLAGILAEAGGSAGAVQHVVLGFGINVLPAAFPPDVAARATSLESELGRRWIADWCWRNALPRSPIATQALQRGER